MSADHQTPPDNQTCLVSAALESRQQADRQSTGRPCKITIKIRKEGRSVAAPPRMAEIDYDLIRRHRASTAPLEGDAVQHVQLRHGLAAELHPYPGCRLRRLHKVA